MGTRSRAEQEESRQMDEGDRMYSTLFPRQALLHLRIGNPGPPYIITARTNDRLTLTTPPHILG